MRGSVTVPVTLNNKTITQNFSIIKDLDNQAILGSDFMQKNKILLDMESGIVSHKNESYGKTNIKIYPTSKTFIPENHHTKIKCLLTTEDSSFLHPGSTVLTTRSELMPGVILEESLTKVLRHNVIFVVITNTNPYQVCVKPTMLLGHVSDTASKMFIPVEEAKIASLNNTNNSGPIPTLSQEKAKYLTQNLNCPAEPDIRARYEQLILINHDCFAHDKFDLGFSDIVTHHIHMKNKQPIYTKQFRIPDAHQKEIVNHIEQLKSQNVIEECSSPYNSPVFCVQKKDGSLRIVQDLRKINAASYEDKYAIKDVTECIDMIGNADSSIFSTLDMASGFWQQNLSEDSRDMTAFTLPHINTQFRWTRTSQGLQGAPASFSRLTALVFRGIEKVITYIDDVFTHSQSHEDQLNILQACFDRMRKYNLKFNIKKCVFGADQVAYLGFQISKDGVSPATDKVAAVQKFQPPTTMKEVRAFIGFCNYFRRMVSNFSRIASPLIAMTKKNCVWKSGPLPDQALQSFNTLKQTLCSSPVIGFSRTGGQYILTVDASTTGLGAILSQNFENTETIISYWSRTLRDHEKNYTPYMLEMTAVCSALEHYHENLFGKKTIVYTDHRPLLGTSTIQKKTINRLVEKMNIYNIDLRYKKGITNSGADYLSRNAQNEIMEIRQHDRFHTIIEQQRNDVLTNGIKLFLQNNILPPEERTKTLVLNLAPRCFLKDNLLWFVPPKLNISKAVLFTPISMTQIIIKNAHGTPMSGHWAVGRTVQRISESYFWPSLTKDVSNFITNCTACQKVQRPPTHAELTPWQPCSKPNERIHCDLFGPLKGDGTHKYVAVITDAFTKWTEVIPIPNKEANTIAKSIFEEWICRRGVMLQLITDGGKEFANKILEELCTLMQIKKHVVTAYHPQANGQVERFNRDMKKYLTTMLDDTTDWVSYLKPLQFAHNTAINKSTMLTPHYLTYFDDPRLPNCIDVPTITYSSSYSADSIRRMQYAYRLVYKNNADAREAYTSYYNKKTRTRQFELGDEVLITFPVDQHIPNKKLASIWKGPFSITKICDKNILEVKASPRSKTIKVHTNRVRLFHHFNDIVSNQDTTPTLPVPQEPITPPSEEEEESEYDFGFEEDNQPIIQEAQVPLVPPVTLHRQNGQWQINPPQPLNARDQLATELFGPPRTRARGPVQDNNPLPNRPAEYKPVGKRK